MAEYRLTNQAVADLSAIWNYTYDNWSEEQADKYQQNLYDTFQAIADYPISGKIYDKVSSEIRGLRSYRHIIFYRITDTEWIEITRILHGRMDLKNLIDE